MEGNLLLQLFSKLDTEIHSKLGQAFVLLQQPQNKIREIIRNAYPTKVKRIIICSNY